MKLTCQTGGVDQKSFAKYPIVDVVEVDFPSTVNYDGHRYYLTRKVGRRNDTGLVCAEYQYSGTVSNPRDCRVWLDVAGNIFPD